MGTEGGHRKRINLFRKLSLAVCMLLLPLQTEAAILTNGGLELPAGVDFKTVLPGTSYAGWFCEGPGDIEFLAQNSFAPVAQGTGAVDLNGANYHGSISQTVRTTPGVAYQLRFAMSGNPGGPGQPDLVDKTMAVFWNGTNAGSFTFVHLPGDTQASLRWQYHELSVTGTGTNVLKFASTTTDDRTGGPVLDDISLAGIAPNVTIAVSQVQICWDSLTNVSYQPQFRSVLTSNTWIALGSPLQGTGARVCVTDPVSPGQPQKFYRVEATP
jgi:hypothetical protein